jgi:cold shock protein
LASFSLKTARPTSSSTISDVERSGLGSLKEGQRVAYELMRGKNGKSNATNLKAA